MAAHIFGRGQKLYVAEFDLSGYARTLAVSDEADAQDATTMADTTRRMIPGVRTVSWDAELTFDAAVDERLAALFASANSAGGMGDGTATMMSFMPGGATEGQLAYFMRSMIGAANVPMQFGETFVQSVSGAPYDGGRGAGSAELARGTVACVVTTAAAGSGNRPGYLLGALTDSLDQIQLAGHCTAIAGSSPLLTLNVQSDDNAGFTSPTTRYSATAISAAGAIDIPPIAGPITDSYWRITWSLTGTGVSASFVASLAKTRRAVAP